MKKKYMYRWAALCVLLEIQCLNALPSLKTLYSYPKGIAQKFFSAARKIYHWRQPDLFLPTLDQLNVVTFIPVSKAEPEQQNTTKGDVIKLLKANNKDGRLIINGTIYEVHRGIPNIIKDVQIPITVYSGGYSNNRMPYAYCGYTAIKAGLMPGACVTFDFATDTRRGFNFCQQQDLHCVQTVCDAIVQKSPGCSLILHGACKGAANNFRFLAEQAEQEKQAKYMKNIKAMIAESPPISVAKALQHTPCVKITLFLMRGIFPNYNPKAKTIMQAQKFPHIPVMIASLPEDTISELCDVTAMMCHLNNDCGGNIQLFVSQENKIQHGQIGKAKDYQKEIETFFKKIFGSK